MTNRVLRRKMEAANPYARDAIEQGRPQRQCQRCIRSWRKTVAVGLFCMVGVLGVEGSQQDLVLTIDEPTSKKNYGYPEFYNKIEIKDTFTLDNSYLTNGYTGASISIGNDQSPIVVTITNAVKQSLPTISEATLNWTGKGARIDLAATTAPEIGWGSQFKNPPLSEVFGQNAYEGNGGTFGRQLKAYFNIDADAVHADKVVDVLHLYANGYFGFKEFHNQTPGSIARILFDGGRTYSGHSSGTWFQPNAGTEIRLESLNGNPIYLWHYYSNCSFTTANGTGETGTVSTRGSADVVFGGPSNNSIPTVKLNGCVNWGHSGDTYLVGSCYYKMMNDDFLPYGEGLGAVYVMRYCKKYDTGYKYDNSVSCWLDLNGTTQKVNSILAYEDTTVKGRTFVTNTASKRATLEVGEFAADTTLKGVFTGNFDIRLKCSSNPRFEDNLFSVANGADLYLASTDWTITGERSFDSQFMHQPDGYKTIFSNACMSAFSTVGGQTVIANTLWNVYIKGISPETFSHPPATIVRDLPPTFLWNFSLRDDNTLNVSNGALVTSNLTASACSHIVVSSNGSIRVQSAAAKPGASRYYRFTCKENFGKKQFAFGSITFVKEDRTSYAPGKSAVGYSLNETATSATDLQEGEFMYNGTPFVGNGSTLPTTFPSSYRQSSYDYVKAGIFGSDGVRKLTTFDDGKTTMDRNNAETWRVFTIRFKSDAPAVVGYRLSNEAWNIDAHISCWLVETSEDGLNWSTLDERTDYGSFSYKSGQGSPSNPLTEGYGCFNANTSAYGSDDADSGEGSIFRWTKNVDPKTVCADFAGVTMRVDCGGVLDLAQTDGTATLENIEADCTSGMGVFRHVSLAETGSFNLVNDGSALRAHTYLPAVFENCEGLSNLNNWRVTLNGESVNDCSVSYDVQKGRIDVHIKRGIVLIVR